MKKGRHSIEQIIRFQRDFEGFGFEQLLGQQLFELAILFPQIAQTLRVAQIHAAILLLIAVKGRLADAVPTWAPQTDPLRLR